MFLSALLLITAPNYSHDPPLRITSDRASFLRQCENAVELEIRDDDSNGSIDLSVDTLACDAFIRGVWGGHENLVALNLVERQFCIPLDVPMSQVRRAIVAHMKEIAADEPVGDGAFAVLTSLRFIFGCRQQ